MSAWARHLGVRQASLNRWMLGDSSPDLANLKILSDKLGKEIYTVFGVELPEGDEFDDVPGQFGIRLRAALSEYRTQLRQKNLSPNSDAAADLFSECLKHQGWL